MDFIIVMLNGRPKAAGRAAPNSAGRGQPAETAGRYRPSGRPARPASRNLKKIRLIEFKDLFYPFLSLFSTLRAPKTHFWTCSIHFYHFFQPFGLLRHIFGPVLTIFSTFIKRKSLLGVQKWVLGARRVEKSDNNGWKRL